MTFVFPGRNSWSGTFHSREAHRRWLERLVRVGVKTDVDEVAVGGWPWNMTACMRGRSWRDAPAGFDNKTNDFEEQSEFDDDRVAFEKVETVDDGLGPVFNGTSCVGCHLNPVTGDGRVSVTKILQGCGACWSRQRRGRRPAAAGSPRGGG